MFQDNNMSENAVFLFTFTVKCSKYNSMLHVAVVISLHSSTEKTALSDSGAYGLVEYFSNR